MTKFAIYLNELTPGLKDKVAPTDSRLRPDQHALEEGVYDQVRISFLAFHAFQRHVRQAQQAQLVPYWSSQLSPVSSVLCYPNTFVFK